MSTPERGPSLCSFADYEQGKRFIVSPDRLCIDGIYTFAVKPFRSYSSEAFLFSSKVVAVKPQEDGARPYSVSLIIEDAERTNVFEAPSPPLPSTADGLISPHAGRPKGFDEAYLRHTFTSIDEELQRIEEIKTKPFRVETVPFVLPTH